MNRKEEALLKIILIEQIKTRTDLLKDQVIQRRQSQELRILIAKVRHLERRTHEMNKKLDKIISLSMSKATHLRIEEDK